MRARIREISPAIDLPTNDPGTAARTAKNAHAAPGLPNQPMNDYSGRKPMVDTITPVGEADRESTTEPTMAQQQADGLRALAAFIEANPQFADMFDTTFSYSGINAHISRFEDKAAVMGEVARVAVRAGATVDKKINDQWHNLVVRFGAVKFEVLAYREEVCERVVVGTETVTKRVPDPARLAEVPEVEVTETVERVEWRCTPLLATTRRGGEAA